MWRNYLTGSFSFSPRSWVLTVMFFFASSFPVFLSGQEMITIPVEILGQIEAEVSNQKSLVQKLYDNEKKILDQNNQLLTSNQNLIWDLEDSKLYCGKLEKKVRLLTIGTTILAGTTASLVLLELLRSLLK